jgi:Peptidase family M23
LLILTTPRRLVVLLFVFLMWTPAAYAWSWPVQGPVLQPFAYDQSHPYASGQHRGIDIGADAAGETVVAPAAGTVSFGGSVPTNGKSVTIQTADGYSVTLTHLGSIAVAEGAAVGEQDAVGTVGPSGTPEVDGPYVHLGIRVTADPNGYVDPLGLLPPVVGDGATQSDSSLSQPASNGASSASPGSKRAAPAPKSPPAAVTDRSHVRVHREHPDARPEGASQRASRPAKVRVRAPHETHAQRPVVETAAPIVEHVRLGAGHAIRPSAPVAQPKPEPSSRAGALVCNGVTLLFALSAAVAASRRRRRPRAQVLHLPRSTLAHRRAA